MAEPLPANLRGKRVLIVEDEYTTAFDLAGWLEESGAEVVGPSGSVEHALEMVRSHGGRLDAAVLDINLRGRRVYPVADALAARSVPFVFATGYDALTVPTVYSGVPRCEKPISREHLIRLLSSQFASGGS